MLLGKNWIGYRIVENLKRISKILNSNNKQQIYKKIKIKIPKYLQEK